MNACADLLSACDDSEAARIELDNALVALAYDHAERNAIGALGADITNAARYALVEALDEVKRATAIATKAITQHLPAFGLAQTILNQTAQGVAPDPSMLSQISQSVEAVTAAHDLGRAPNARLLVAFKHLYFTIRAVQDALYRTLLALLQNQKPGRYGSMNKAADVEANPVRKQLGEFGEDYFAWFRGWRALREQ